MSAWRWLMCIALFCVDVRVRAEELAGSCWDKEMPCPVQANDRRRLVESEGLKISLAAGSLVEQRDADSVQLVQGSFYIFTSRAVVFKTPYAQFECEDECKALVEREPLRLTLKSLAGRWLVTRKGETQQYALPAGLQILLGEVEPNGRAQMEFPQSLPWLSTVKSWAKLYPGSAKELRQEVADFRPAWREAVEAVSRLHLDTAKRAIASYESNQAQELARQKARAREDESLRSLFRAKNNLGQ